MSNITLSLALLVALLGAAVGAIAWVTIANRQRQAVVRRAAGTSEQTISAIRPARQPIFQGPVDWLAARVPAQLSTGNVSTSRLVHAGLEGPAAAPIYALIRVASLILFVSVALVFTPHDDPLIYTAGIVIGVVLGLLAPPGMLDRLAENRMARIRRSMPDALDLLVVCVEAGVALDAAIQRVARELYMLHPTLSDELLGMSRRISAGMPREQAMHGLYLRTGVEELRGLSSHMLQSEKWGTSIATVLRLYAEQLRHKRRVAAERRAATASTRMLLPLALFIFPTLFVVLLGPAVIRIATQF